jgi:hypothetical protein
MGACALRKLMLIPWTGLAHLTFASTHLLYPCAYKWVWMCEWSMVATFIWLWNLVTCVGKKIVKPLILVVLQTGMNFFFVCVFAIYDVWHMWWKLTEDREEPCVDKYKTIKNHWTVAALLHWYWFHSENCKHWLLLKRGCKYVCPPSCIQQFTVEQSTSE